MQLLDIRVSGRLQPAAEAMKRGEPLPRAMLGGARVEVIVEVRREGSGSQPAGEEEQGEPQANGVLLDEEGRLSLERYLTSDVSLQLILPIIMALATPAPAEQEGTRQGLTGEDSQPMATQNRMVDRRARVRFEIVGELWGTLEVMEPLAVRNIGRGGALFESGVPLKADSLQTMQLVFRSQESEIQGRVRHVTTTPGATGGERYLIGFEFLRMQQSTRQQIDQLVSGTGGRPQGPQEG